jgi:hypothetical protein
LCGERKEEFSTRQGRKGERKRNARKGDAQKLRMARRLHLETMMTLTWTAQGLNMGAAGSVADLVRDTERKE